jgi:NADH:ubiquinone oxidoreductase subunit C
MESQEADKNPVVQRLRQWDAEAVSEVIEFRGETTVVVPRTHLSRASAYLASEPFLYFAFLSDITTVDRFPIEPRFEVNYHLLSIARSDRLRLKVYPETIRRCHPSLRCGRPRTGTNAKITICSEFDSKVIPICAAF